MKPKVATPGKRDTITEMKTSFRKMTTQAFMAAALMTLIAACHGDAPQLHEATGQRPTLTEYGDFQCGYCAQFAVFILPELRKDFIDTGKLDFRYSHFPILGPGSWTAANAAECAREQGRFEAYHDGLFVALATGEMEATAEGMNWLAGETGLATTPFSQCLDQGRYEENIKTQFQQGVEAGVRGTPTLAIEGRLLEWTNYRDLKSQLDQWVDHHATQNAARKTP